MKKVAILAQTKEGQLSEQTKQLISFVSAFHPEQIKLFIIGDVKFSTVPSSVPVDLIQLSADLYADSESVDTIANGLDNFSVFGIKSIQIDNMLSLLAANTKKDMISGIQTLSYSSDKFSISKSIFSGKASLELSTSTASFFSINRNFDFSRISEYSELAFKSSSSIEKTNTNKASIVSILPITGSIPLPDAAIVVGAGRGLKDPGNWTIVEDLAKALGAATACSKPVSDLNWRPHHEHVGQTGVKISPNLYIACGISGAIQHLAGVNGSRIVVVINNDPEAPFFKHADYGIVGDVNDILPRLTKKLQSH
jgi:electron transfer flavoprotein alpha subunit